MSSVAEKALSIAAACAAIRCSARDVRCLAAMDSMTCSSHCFRYRRVGHGRLVLIAHALPVETSEPTRPAVATPVSCRRVVLCCGSDEQKVAASASVGEVFFDRPGLRDFSDRQYAATFSVSPT